MSLFRSILVSRAGHDQQCVLMRQTLYQQRACRRELSIGAPIIVIGGGAVGASAALWLRTIAPLREVVVIERDSSYRYASTPRSVGGIRLQFSCEENVRLSAFGLEVVKDAEQTLGASVNFRPSGYLFLASAAGEAAMREAHATQTAAGATIELLSPAAIAADYPWLCRDGIVLGARGAGEGAFDPHLFLSATRAAAVAKGVKFVEGSVSGLLRGRGCQSFDDVRSVKVELRGESMLCMGRQR